MIPPCDFAFSDLCLLFFVYLKLKSKHHDKKTQQQPNQTNNKKKTVFLKQAAAIATIISWMFLPACCY